MTVKLTFLGTGDAIPTVKRNHQATLLSYNSENILIDCGEGTQRQFRMAKLNPLKITRILITHWHGDHILGLPGLFQTLAFDDYKKTLHIYGPKGTKRYVSELKKIFVFKDKLNIKVEEVGDTQGRTPKNIQKNIFTRGKFFETDDFYLEAKAMTHGPPTNAYSFVKKGKLRIDKKKLKKSGLPVGIHLKKLKQGKDIKFKGKTYKAKNLTYSSDSLKISFVMDTTFNKNIIPFVKGSDLFISESQFGSELAKKAKEHKHMIAKQVGEIAKKAKVKKLVLTHISQRYDKNPKKILNEAKKVFRNSRLVNDLDVIEVK